MTSNWRVNPSISGGGLFYDIAPHQIDLMIYFFGAYQQALGISNNQAQVYSTNDIISGIISFQNKIQVRGVWCFNSSEHIYKNHCIIYGHQGTITFSFSGKEVKIQRKNKVEVFDFQLPINIQQPMIEKTVSYFLGNQENPCSVEQGLIVTSIMESLSTKNAKNIV